MLHAERDKEGAYIHKLEIQRILSTLAVPSQLGVGERAQKLAPIYSHDTTTTSASSGSGTPSSSLILYGFVLLSQLQPSSLGAFD